MSMLIYVFSGGSRHPGFGNDNRTLPKDEFSGAGLLVREKNCARASEDSNSGFLSFVLISSRDNQNALFI